MVRWLTFGSNGIGHGGKHAVMNHELPNAAPSRTGVDADSRRWLAAGCLSCLVGRPSWATLKPDVKASAEAQFRLSAIQALAATGAVLVLIYTARNYRLTRRGQETDRFVKALERLGSHERYVRVGGVLAMDQIVEDAPGQATHAAQVLNAFVRDRAPRRARWESNTGQRITAARRAVRHRVASRTDPKSARPGVPDIDVQQALTVLTRPSFRLHVASTESVYAPGLRLSFTQLSGAALANASLTMSDLTGAQLDRADLTGALLGGAILHGVRLDNAILVGAQLARADLAGALAREADFTDAQLFEANLTNAWLGGATFTGALLGGTNLTNAWLGGANLETAQGLTVPQVVLARLTKDTRLPPVIATAPRVIARIEEFEGFRE